MTPRKPLAAPVRLPRAWVVLLGAWLLGAGAWAAPRTPASDDVVLEQLPQRRDGTLQRELAELRARLRAAPADADAAVALARRLYEAWSADGDPRHLGHAQAALARWWSTPTPPREVRVMRAVLRQLNHDFDAALVDLDAAVREEPADATAWSWIAAVAMVRADYGRAREACTEMQDLGVEPVASACLAQVDATTGQGPRATAALRQALAHPEADDPALRLWLLTRLAETEQHLGRAAAAEAAFREALALQRPDGYLLAAYADFLLETGRPEQVLTLLKTAQRADALLLRLAIAARRLQTDTAGAWADALGARFDAARARGDTTHRKEEARYWLEVRGDARRALPLASLNFAEQREPSDARLLLEAAWAARQPAAAAPALAWLSTSRHDGTALRQLASRLRELP